jgi:hypothetical protein
VTTMENPVRGERGLQPLDGAVKSGDGACSGDLAQPHERTSSFPGSRCAFQHGIEAARAGC